MSPTRLLSGTPADLGSETGTVAVEMHDRDVAAPTAVTSVPFRDGGFLHEALLYDGLDEFATGTASFVREGLAAGDPVLAALDRDKIDALRSELGPQADGLCWTDIRALGTNPARILPVWEEFVRRTAGRGRYPRGIGEPMWPGRTPDEVVETQHHESLLNVAFHGGPPWRLLCPYDTAALPPDVVDEARRSHPYVWEGDLRRPSDAHVDGGDPLRPFTGPLAESPRGAAELSFATTERLDAIRRFVTAFARDAGLPRQRTDEFVLAVNEVATNSLRHGGGTGRLRIWNEDRRVVCEIRDHGRLAEPLVGRRHPRPDDTGGRGVWLANQLCDLVQLRSSGSGTVVRLHMHLP